MAKFLVATLAFKSNRLMPLPPKLLDFRSPKAHGFNNLSKAAQQKAPALKKAT
jgi:hypothetical protein